METGASAKAAGMATALSGSDPTWRERFERAIAKLPRGTTFVSEDITDEVGLPSKVGGVNRNNGVGAVINAIARTGMIEKTGVHIRARRRSSHATELTEWRRA